MKTIVNNDLTLVELNLLYSSIQHIVTSVKDLLGSVPALRELSLDYKKTLYSIFWSMSEERLYVRHFKTSVANLNTQQFRNDCLRSANEFQNFFRYCGDSQTRVVIELMRITYQFNFLQNKLAANGLKITQSNLLTYVHHNN
jgi:hypothetical protein